MFDVKVMNVTGPVGRPGWLEVVTDTEHFVHVVQGYYRKLPPPLEPNLSTRVIYGT